MKYAFRLLSALLALTAGSTPSEAAITFTKIAGTDTAIPGGTGNFDNFGYDPQVSGGTVPFRGRGPGPQEGIYSWSNGTLSVVADRNTTIPGTASTFYSFYAVAISGERIGFNGESSVEDGVYSSLNGTISAIATTNSPIPGGSGNFTSIPHELRLSGDNAAFLAFGSGQRGLYAEINGGLERIGDLNSAIPNGTGNFTRFDGFDLSGDTVIFKGVGDSGQIGIYSGSGDNISVLHDTSTPIPGGIGTFTSFSGPDISGDNYVFTGFGIGGQSGVYAEIDGSFLLVADENTPVPGGIGNFKSFTGNTGMSGDEILFHGSQHNGVDGYYVYHDGNIRELITTAFPLEGKTMNSLVASEIDGEYMTFQADFTDGSKAIYHVSGIPEPSRTLLAVLGVVAVLLHRRCG